MNPRWASTPEWARPVIQSLEQYLARPTFYNGIELGDGTPPTKNQDGVTTKPPTMRVDSGAQKPVIGPVGTLDIVDGAITTLKLDLQAVDNARIAVGAIQGDVIAAGAITSTKVADGAIESPKITAGAVTTAKLAAAAVTANEIAANAVTASKILAGEIGTGHLTALAVTSEKIAANAITAAKLAALSVEVGKWIRSSNYVSGSSGWAIDGNGNCEFNDVTVRGTILSPNFQTVSSGARVRMGSAWTAADEIQFLGSSGGIGSIRNGQYALGWSTSMRLSAGGIIDLFYDGGNKAEVTAAQGIKLNGPTTVIGALSATSVTATDMNINSSPVIHTGNVGSYAAPVNGSTGNFWYCSDIYLNSIQQTGFISPNVSYSGNRLYQYISSRKYKKSILPLSATNDLLKLEPVTWLSRLTPDDLGGGDPPNTRIVGLIAEDAAAVSERFATYAADGTPNGIHWPAITTFLIGEVKRLRADVNRIQGTTGASS